MGYIFIVIVSAIEGGMNYLGKKISMLAKSLQDLSLVNGTRSILMVLVGSVLALVTGGFSLTFTSPETIWNVIVSGFVWSLGLYFWYIAIQNGPLIVSNVVGATTLLVPVFLSAIFYGEKVSVGQYIGLLLFFGAIYFMSAYDKEKDGKIRLLPIVSALINALLAGINNFLQKAYVYSGEEMGATMYTVFVYLFGFIWFFLFLLCFKHLGSTRLMQFVNRFSLKTDAPLTARKALGQHGGILTLMALFTFVKTALTTEAAVLVPSVILFPLNKGLGMICVFFVSAVIFKEKPTWRSIGGIGLSILSMLVINFL